MTNAMTLTFTCLLSRCGTSCWIFYILSFSSTHRLGSWKPVYEGFTAIALVRYWVLQAHVINSSNIDSLTSGSGWKRQPKICLFIYVIYVLASFSFDCFIANICESKFIRSNLSIHWVILWKKMIVGVGLKQQRKYQCWFYLAKLQTGFAFF